MSGAAAAREPVVPIARSTMNRLTEKGEVGVRLLTISTARLRHDDGGPSQLSSVAGGPKTLFHPHGWGERIMSNYAHRAKWEFMKR